MDRSTQLSMVTGMTSMVSQGYGAVPAAIDPWISNGITVLTAEPRWTRKWNRKILEICMGGREDERD